MKKFYPTIFTKIYNGFLIEVPDLEILSEDSDLDDAIAMARDAISITIKSLQENKETIPNASNIKDISVAKGTFSSNGSSLVLLVDIDI